MSGTFTIKFDIPPIDIRLHLIGHDDARLTQSISELKDIIMATRDEFLTQVNDLKSQLDTANATLTKSQAEVTSAVGTLTSTVAANNQRIADLEAALAAAGGDIPPEVVSAFAAAKASADAVTASAKALDDLNPDAPPTA